MSLGVDLCRGHLFEECRALIFELDATNCQLVDSWGRIEANTAMKVELEGRAINANVHIDLTESSTLSFLFDLAESEGVSVISKPYRGAEFRFVDLL